MRNGLIEFRQDREAEPRFTVPPVGGDRGGMASRGGYGGGGAPGAGPRQIYVANVCSLSP